MNTPVTDFAGLELAIAAARPADDGRLIVVIAGAPGAGKSTLVERLLASPKLDRAALLPMDGFHLDNRILDAAGWRERKGAPFTFDSGGYVATLARARRDDAELYVPEFDRAADLARAAAIRIGPEHRIVLTEGNYLLLDQPPWKAVKDLADLTLFIDVPLAELERRLLRRWLDHGLAPAEAQARAEQNDLVNARLVVAESAAADFIYRD